MQRSDEEDIALFSVILEVGTVKVNFCLLDILADVGKGSLCLDRKIEGRLIRNSEIGRSTGGIDFFIRTVKLKLANM